METRINLQTQFDGDLIAKEVPTERILELILNAPLSSVSNSRPSLNLAVVIDRSGSMQGAKLEYVKRAAVHVLDLLTERDQVALVIYDSEVELLSPSIAMAPGNRVTLTRKIQQVTARSSTNLGGGWLQGCQEVALAAREGDLNRVLLLTDGLANVGITDLEELGIHAGQLLERGVSTSTFGVGLDFNEYLMENMANQGGGRFYFIEDPASIPAIFEQEFQSLSTVTASHIQLALTIPNGVSAQVLGSWRNELEGEKLVVMLGDLAAGLKREIYIRLLTPPQKKQTYLSIPVTLNAHDETGQSYSLEQILSLSYASQPKVSAMDQRKDVMARYSEVLLADQASEALKLERAGEREKARRLMDASILSSSPHTSSKIREDYQHLSERLARGLDEQDRKDRHQEEYIRKQRRR